MRKVQYIRGAAVGMVELLKLDPMARKMKVHVDGFYKAIEDSDSSSARNHINEILKYGEYLSNDIEQIITKRDTSEGVNDMFGGGFPVPKFNTVEHIHKSNPNVLPGTVRTNRIGSIMRPQSNRTLQ
tara:strand:- start:179 stop:559 length:381 start_codon:yes stop_codon:yes gene_type:complete